MKIINRIIIIPFALLLLAGLFEQGLLTLAALLAIPLGFLQVLFCLRIIISWKSINRKVKVFELSYFILVGVYFLLFNYSTSGALWDNKLIQLVVYCLPVLLAFSVTFLLEKINYENIE